MQYHRAIWDFHTGDFINNATHSYDAKPIGWLIIVRPLCMHYHGDIAAGTDGCTGPGDLRQRGAGDRDAGAVVGRRDRADRRRDLVGRGPRLAVRHPGRRRAERLAAVVLLRHPPGLLLLRDRARARSP